jgi:hypothetical protein
LISHCESNAESKNRWSYGDSNSGPLACHAILTEVWASLDEAGLAVCLRESGLEESGRLPSCLHGGYQNCPQRPLDYQDGGLVLDYGGGCDAAVVRGEAGQDVVDMREPQVQIQEGLAAILSVRLQRAASAHSLHILPELAFSPLVVHVGGV